MLKQNLFLFAVLNLLFTIYGCKKVYNEPAPVDNYTSLANFYAINGVVPQNYNINNATGGSFTTPQGTTVSIPANCFLTTGNYPVTGNVTISFMDIYKKSDMLLTCIPTNLTTGLPIKSGGEFYIRATQGDSAMQIATGLKIKITQPLQGQALDSSMKAFRISNDSSAFTNPSGTNTNGNGTNLNYQGTWSATQMDSVFYASNAYVYNLYQISEQPQGFGTWGNTDNSSYFSNYPQTTIQMNLSSSFSIEYTNVYLVFEGINSVVLADASSYSPSGMYYLYQYAPLGLSCTVVAITLVNGKLYSSFVPLTIGKNSVVNFNLTETTSAAFKAQLQALN